jgi:hypothetical protein
MTPSIGCRLSIGKSKRHLRTIDRNIALVNDPFVQLMLEAKYGRGTCKAIQRLEELRLRYYKRSAASVRKTLEDQLDHFGLKPGKSRRRSRKLEGRYPWRPEFTGYHLDQQGRPSGLTDTIKLAFKAAKALDVPARTFLKPKPSGWEFCRTKVFFLVPSCNPLANLEHLRSVLLRVSLPRRISGTTLFPSVDNNRYHNSRSIYIRSIAFISDEKAFVVFGDQEGVIPAFRIEPQQDFEHYGAVRDALKKERIG